MKKQLKDLKRGETFRGAGIEWLVLGHDKSSQGLPFRTFVVSADITEKRAFDEGNKCDFAASSLRTYLNGTFLRKLEAEFGAENILEHTIDLTADDGLSKYGADRAATIAVTGRTDAAASFSFSANTRCCKLIPLPKSLPLSYQISRLLAS